ncbi:MAG: HAMP domain-containing sensor histidine kinase [Micromonosporaceae bacterium]
MRRYTLRARVIAGFTGGALLLSTSMALISYQLTRSSLLGGRERATVRAAYLDAAVVRAGLAAEQPDLLEILRSLDTGENRRVVLRRNGEWYSRTAGVPSAVPPALQEMVEQGRAGVQLVRADGRPAVVVGVPLSSSTALYEVDSLRELDQTLRVLGLVLTLVAVVTAGAGASLGWYASRYVLRPIRSVARAAQEISAGDFSTRLDPAAEPDLAPLTSSFNHMVDQLSERMARDRRFAADVSHELRSPLQTLAAAASVLTRRKEHLDERSATAANLVVLEVARFQSLVNDLVELARSDLPASRGVVDVAELAREVCRSRGVPEDLVEVVDDVPVRWHVDRRRLKQVLGNLLDNAAKHGGGALAVRLGRAGDVCYLEVDDEGPGVSPEDKEVIFDRFVRGRSARARRDDDGAGLGLALVAQHAAAHGGRVLALDRPGGGARFRVELPGALS